MRHDFYSDAELYDILHAPGTAADLRGLLRVCRQFVGPVRGTRWLEPACGTGRYLIAAAGRGVRGMGFDLEAGMVRYAKAQARGAGMGRRVRFFRADMRDFDRQPRLGTFDLAFNLINTIRHLGSDAAMLAHLRGVAAVLAPGGCYAVGLHLCAYGGETETEDVWEGRRGGVRVQQVVQYIPPLGPRGEGARAERVISHLTVTRRGAVTHLDSTYALRGYNLAQWTALLDRAGWVVEGVTSGAGEARAPVDGGYFIFVLRPRPKGARARGVRAR